MIGSNVQIQSCPQVIATCDSLRAEIQTARREGKRIGLAPTMGALHAGHLSLVQACCQECEFNVVTIFVNPTQFGPSEDFDRYPRDLEADLEALSPYPVDLVFVPSTDEIYPSGFSTAVEVGRVADPWEGASRPGHFSGVATVVLKLLNMASPDVAYFGQKDYQQTVVVRQMVRDLNLPVEIRVCPTVRESDGLALSSRNAYLSPDERRQALALSQGLKLAEELARSGEQDAGSIRQAVMDRLTCEPDIQVEYVAVVDPQTLEELNELSNPTLVAMAAFVGPTRLIDNQLIGEYAI